MTNAEKLAAFVTRATCKDLSDSARIGAVRHSSHAVDAIRGKLAAFTLVVLNNESFDPRKVNTYRGS